MKYIILIPFLIFFYKSNAQNSNRLVLEDTTYVMADSSLVLLSTDKAISVEEVVSDLDTQNHTLLQLKSSAPFYIVSNDSLFKIFQKTEEYIIRRSDTINNLFLLGSLKNQRVHLKSFVINKPLNKIFEFTNSQLNNKQESYFNLIIFLTFISIINLIMLKYNFPNRFYQIFNFNRIFSLRSKEVDSNRLRLLDQGGIWVGAYYFITFSIVTFLFYSYHTVTLYGTFWEVLWSFLSLGAIVIILFVGKVILVYLSSFVFKLAKIRVFYIKEMMNLNMFFCTLLIILTVGTFLYNGNLSNSFFQFLKLSVLVLYLIRMILLYFKILKLSGFTKVYLFSYFCTTEIFPLIIGLKYFY